MIGLALVLAVASHVSEAGLGLSSWGSVQDFQTDVHTRPAPENAARAAANAALEARDYEKAEGLLKGLVAAHPQDAALLYDLGSAEDGLDHETAAEADYRAAIAADGKLLPARVALGLLLARAGRLTESRTELAGAVTLDGGDPLLKARAYRAMARLDEKTRPGDARDELLAALKLSPETPEDTLMAAELAAGANGGEPVAAAAYRRVLAERPNDPEAAAALGHLLIQRKHGAEAEALLQPALAAHPNDPGLTSQLALAYEAEGQPAREVPLLESLRKARPDDANVARLLGEVYLEVKNYVAAEPLLAAAAVQNPRDGVLLDDRANALIHLKRFAEAQTLLAPVVAQPALFPSQAALGDAAGHLAFAASENNDPTGALRALDVRATVLPSSPPALFLAAISHDKLHQVKAARLAYQQFLAASNGANPDEEFEAQHRLIALEHMK